jgi:hypothetical protein
MGREIVSEDVDDFEYSPSPKMPGKLVAALTISYPQVFTGPFVVINLPNEETMLKKFVSHVQVSPEHPHVPDLVIGRLGAATSRTCHV